MAAVRRRAFFFKHGRQPSFPDDFAEAEKLFLRGRTQDEGYNAAYANFDRKLIALLDVTEES